MSNPAQGAVGAARVCHKEQMEVWTSEIAGDLSMGGWFREDISYDDKLAIRDTIAGNIRSIVGTAFDLATPRTDSDEGAAGEVKPDPIRLMKEALFACLSEGTHDRNYGGVLVAGGKKAWLRFSVVDAETSAALAAGKTTPAPATPPGVPDSVRALSEAATKGEWYTESEKCDGSYGSGGDCGEGYLAYNILTDAERPHGNPGVIAETSNSTLGVIHEESDEDGHTAWDETARANTAFIVAAVNYVRSLLDVHPAGQSKAESPDAPIPGGFGFEPISPALAADAANLHPAGQSTGEGAETITLTGDPGNRLAPWLLSGTDEDVIEALMRRSAGDVACLFFPTPVNVADPIRRTYHTGRPPRQQRLLAQLLRRLKSAPDSPLTGPVGVEDQQSAWAHAAETVGPDKPWWWTKPWAELGYGSQGDVQAWFQNRDSLRRVVEPDGPDRYIRLYCDPRPHMIAARPAAPEAQGAWSFDMEAAPREHGRELLGWGRLRGSAPMRAIMTWFDAGGDFNGKSGWWTVASLPFEPIAFQPLPAPPSSGQGGR